MAVTSPYTETPPITDGTIDFSAGQDAYHYPDRIAKNAYAKGVNISVKGGIPHPRDGYEKLDFIFDDDTIPTNNTSHLNRSVESVFRFGKFQALIPYFLAPEYYFLIVISGLVYSLNIRLNKITLLSKTLTVNQYSSRINWSLAGNYIVLFDYPNFPLIVQGQTLFRANPLNVVNGLPQPQVPISTIGAYNQNRLFIANAGSEFTGGDPTGSLLTPEAPITFAEVLGPSAAYPGQTFSLGTANTNEPITAMGFLQTIDTNTGIGPLFVATQNAIYSYHTEVPRAQWTTIPNFGTLLLFNAGICGPRALVNVNSDIVFLSGAGRVHALSMSRNDTQLWGDLPISREVENWLKYWDPTLKQFAFLQYFDNRIYVSANPYRVQATTRDGKPITDYVNGGYAVLELNDSATLQGKDPPKWAGLWTGIRPMDMATSNNRCFIIAKHQGENALFRLTPDRTYDLISGKEKNVRSIMYTREFFEDSRFTTKYEQSLSMPIQEVQGDLDVTIDHRPSHSTLFKLWKHWQYTAPFSQCCGVKYPNGLAPHRFRELVFGAPDISQECDPANNLSFSAFRKLQLRLTLKARYWQIEELKLKSVASPSEDLNSACTQEDVVEVPSDCNTDWVNEEESLCNP